MSSGLFYLGTEHLQRLIDLFLERGVLAAGREEEFASVLWRSLSNALPFEEELSSAIRFLAGQSQTPLQSG